MTVSSSRCGLVGEMSVRLCSLTGYEVGIINTEVVIRTDITGLFRFRGLPQSLSRKISGRCFKIDRNLLQPL